MRAIAAALLSLVASGCDGQSTLRSSEPDLSVDTLLRSYAALERSVIDTRKREWRLCAGFVRAADGARRGQADGAAGEWRFLTYTLSGLATAHMAPGVDGCEPNGIAGQDRYPRLSVCGEVRGAGSDLDCACQGVEIAYMTAYNRAILRAAPDAVARNCKARGVAAPRLGG